MEDNLLADLQLTLQGVSLEDFGFVPKEEIQGGKIDTSAQMQVAGNSVASLMASMQGSARVKLQDAKLTNDLVELAGSDVLLEVLNKLNPFIQDDPSTQLECVFAQFNIENGLVQVQDKFSVETGKMRIAGRGSVNLADETLDITFAPSAKTGIGVSVGSLVKFLKLGGTLMAPSPEVDALGALQSGVAIGAAVSTGGVSVLAEGLAKRVVNAGSACDQSQQADE